MLLMPLIMLGIFGFMLLRMLMNGPGGSMNSFIKGNRETMFEQDVTTKFTDVAGLVEAKEQLQDLIEYLKSPERLTALGGKAPMGYLLKGPPGCGKTLLARAVAGEAGVPFIAMSGSDFVEIYVGVGAARVRDVFKQAHAYGRCVIFIDEFEALARIRSGRDLGGSREDDKTLNQLLVELDGVKGRKGIIFMAATNRPELLDPAILRRGRLDIHIEIGRPDVKERRAILGVHAKKVVLAGAANLDTVAQTTVGMSGADLAGLVNDAALLAAKAGEASIKDKHLEEARMRALLGIARASMILSPDDKDRTSVHESGHAALGLITPHATPVKAVSIVPRDRSLGVTVSAHDRDPVSISRNQMLATIIVLCGGRAAEEIVFGKDNVCSGAENDIKVATRLAEEMVVDCGMGKDNAFRAYRHLDGTPFMSASASLGSGAGERIDREVGEILESCYKQALSSLRQHDALLQRLRDELLHKETLDAKALKQLLKETTPKTS